MSMPVCACCVSLGSEKNYISMCHGQVKILRDPVQKIGKFRTSVCLIRGKSTAQELYNYN